MTPNRQSFRPFFRNIFCFVYLDHGIDCSSESRILYFPPKPVVGRAVEILKGGASEMERCTSLLYVYIMLQFPVRPDHSLEAG